jgi:DNA polymerase III epsilon subunit-like protein
MTTFIEKTNRRRVMIFDVETTGLLPKDRTGIPLTELPHILQISFVIFDTQYWRVVKSVDFHINVPSTVEISPLVTELTGITREKCDNGTTILNALLEFQKEYMLCNMIVAHNIQFDREMIRVEMERNREQILTFDTNMIFNAEYEKSANKEIYCTMQMGRNVCKIERVSKLGKTYFKSPKLIELYEHSFGMSPKNLHNSLVDTYVCLRCFVKMRFKFDLSLDMFPDIRFQPIVAEST